MAVCSMQGPELELTGSMTDVRPAQFKWCKRCVCAVGGLLVLSATIGLIIGLSCFGSAAPGPDPSFDNRTANFIVGGHFAKEGEWPFMVSVQDRTGHHFCGGSLINDRWVISAAHCYKSFRPKDLRIVLGKRKLKDGKPGESRDVAEIVRHPKFATHIIAPGRRFTTHDLALLRLTSPVSFNKNIKRVCLAATGSVFLHGTPSWVLGWGQIAENVSLPDPKVLQEVQIPVVDTRHCKLSYPGQITANMICAGLDKGGKGIYHGDSGGPMVSRKHFLSDWVQSGVVSWSRGCAKPNQPGVFTRLDRFEQWIKSTVNSGGLCFKRFGELADPDKRYLEDSVEE